MSIVKDYENYLAKRAEFEKNPMSKYWTKQAERYMEPFRMFGNVYYVGDSWVCVHLIDTGDGLLLIDAGNCGNTAMLIHSIWKAGFDPADVKWILLSHGHVDHVGGVKFMRDMFGTKIYMGEPDAIMYREHPEKSYIQDSPDLMDAPCEPDGVIRDGDEMTFGNVTMKFYLVPGHTEGCIAIFFDVTEGDRTVCAGYYGGFGFNTLATDYLTEIGDPKCHMREVYLESLKKVRNEHVDFFLGNHCINNHMPEKLEAIKNGADRTVWIDPEEWGRYLDEKRDALLKFMKENPAAE